MKFFLGYVRHGAVLLTLSAFSNISGAISLHCRPIITGAQYSGGHGLGTRVIAANALMYFLQDVVGLIAGNAFEQRSAEAASK